MLAEVPVQSDSVADVGMIEMANWVDVDPLNGIDANDLLREVPSAVRMARHAGLPRGSQADQGDLASGIRLAGGNGGAGSGMSGEIGRRLRVAGAGTGDVQVSIAWNNFNDIDLHVMVEAIPPQAGVSIINFMNRRGSCGGWLDVDQNIQPTTQHAVENILWASGIAPYAQYTVAVHHYHDWGGPHPTEVAVVILVDGKQTYFTTSVSAAARCPWHERVIDFLVCVTAWASNTARMGLTATFSTAVWMVGFATSTATAPRPGIRSIQPLPAMPFSTAESVGRIWPSDACFRPPKVEPHTQRAVVVAVG